MSDSRASRETKTFRGYGISVYIDSGEETAPNLLGSANAKEFTVNARLKITAPDGTVQELSRYDSRSSQETVSFDGYGLTVESDSGEETATSLLGSAKSRKATGKARVEVTAPDGTVKEQCWYDSRAPLEVVTFHD